MGIWRRNSIGCIYLRSALSIIWLPVRLIGHLLMWPRNPVSHATGPTTSVNENATHAPPANTTTTQPSNASPTPNNALPEPSSTPLPTNASPLSADRGSDLMPILANVSLFVLRDNTIIRLPRLARLRPLSVSLGIITIRQPRNAR